MSQNRRSLEIVAQESGHAGRLLRPLSALCLDETDLERLGWVDRSRLLGIRGRNRQVQMELARHYGLNDYPAPAGGCRLTEPAFAGRVRDLRARGGIRDLRQARLLTLGRHFRLGDKVKLIVGRNQAENAALEAAAGQDIVLDFEGIPGPVGLLSAGGNESDVQAAAALCSRYSDAPRGQPVLVRVRASGATRTLRVSPMSEADAEARRIA